MDYTLWLCHGLLCMKQMKAEDVDTMWITRLLASTTVWQRAGPSAFINLCIWSILQGICSKSVFSLLWEQTWGELGHHLTLILVVSQQISPGRTPGQLAKKVPSARSSASNIISLLQQMKTRNGHCGNPEHPIFNYDDSKFEWMQEDHHHILETG